MRKSGSFSKPTAKRSAEREVAVGMGKTASATFEGLPEYPYYIAEIDARDALPLDNRRYAVAPLSRELKVLAITPRPQAVASLRSIPGVTVDVIAPTDYEKSERVRLRFGNLSVRVTQQVAAQSSAVHSAAGE